MSPPTARSAPLTHRRPTSASSQGSEDSTSPSSSSDSAASGKSSSTPPARQSSLDIGPMSPGGETSESSALLPTPGAMTGGQNDEPPEMWREPAMTAPLEIAKEVLRVEGESPGTLRQFTINTESAPTLAAEVVRLSEILQMTDLIAEGCESGAEGGTDAVLQSTTPAVRNAALTEAANIAQEVGAYDARIKAYEFRWTKMRAHIEELEADNQRLREALEGVRDSLCDPSECFSHHQGHKAARTARAALKEESR